MSKSDDEDAEFTAGYHEEAERLGQRLSKKTTTNRCPFCATDDWRLLDTQIAKSRVILTGGFTVEAYTLICANCGFIRQHLRDTVDDQ